MYAEAVLAKCLCLQHKHCWWCYFLFWCHLTEVCLCDVLWSVFLAMNQDWVWIWMMSTDGMQEFRGLLGANNMHYEFDWMNKVLTAFSTLTFCYFNVNGLHCSMLWCRKSSHLKLIIVISKFLKRYSKTKRTRAPAYSRALRRYQWLTTWVSWSMCEICISHYLII